MANIQERRNKEGKLISYSIRVHRGRDTSGRQLKPYTTTFEVPEGWNEGRAFREANKAAILFEKQCREGVAFDSKEKFADYADYVINLKQRTGAKHSTIERYKSLLIRINEHIGHIKIGNIRPQHLNKFYEQLSQDGVNLNTGGRLSNKTIIEYHRLISTIMAQAEKEMLVPYNMARKATPPKLERKEPNYFQIEDIERIRDCLENEPIKFKVATHLLLVTGCRRGEIMGLKWDKVDFKNNQLKIDNNLLYAVDTGIYEDTPKTTTSNRTIKIPMETMKLVKEYKAWYMEQRLLNGDRWMNTDFLFTQENGSPMHPDTLTDWLNKFSKRHNLPHVNPKAFRHTMASILYYNGVDSITISKRLGHAKVSTTTDIYSHIMKQADEEAAECIADVILKRKNR